MLAASDRRLLSEQGHVTSGRHKVKSHHLLFSQGRKHLLGCACQAAQLSTWGGANVPHIMIPQWLQQRRSDPYGWPSCEQMCMTSEGAVSPTGATSLLPQ